MGGAWKVYDGDTYTTAAGRRDTTQPTTLSSHSACAWHDDPSGQEPGRVLRRDCPSIGTSNCRCTFFILLEKEDSWDCLSEGHQDG